MKIESNYLSIGLMIFIRAGLFLFFYINFLEKNDC